MKHHHIFYLTLCGFIGFVGENANSQGTLTFQNLDFENGTFISIPGQFNTVEFGPAMPGWTGYLGTNQVSSILYNDLFLSQAGMAIWGPDNPSPSLFHGQYYVVLQNSSPPAAGNGPSLTQTGTIPGTAKSIQFYLAFGGMGVSFGGQQIPLSVLGSSPTGYNIYGGDISAFAGLTGELKFQGVGYLDFIQFSNQPIPEPSTLGLLGLGAWLFGWRFGRGTSAPPTSPRPPTPQMN